MKKVLSFFAAVLFMSAMTFSAYAMETPTMDDPPKTKEVVKADKDKAATTTETEKKTSEKDCVKVCDDEKMKTSCCSKDKKK